jgi:hypothetical protein
VRLVLRVAAALVCAWLLGPTLWGPRLARADDDLRLTYYTVESAHFRVTYPDTLEEYAKRVLALSEAIYERLTPAMQYAPEMKTEVLLTDNTESANGSATPVPYDAIRLFATAPDDLSNLGDYDDWMLTLVTHEYLHILHTGNISGGAAIVNRVLGRTLSPNSAQPRWVIEGLAVVYESGFTTGGRIRSTLFDTFLRADVLEDNFATLGQISSGADRWPFGNLYYLYGSRFIQWMADVYGTDIFSALSADYGAQSVPLAINRAIRRVTRVTYDDLYGAWHEHLKLHYGKMVTAIDARGRREGQRITFRGGEASYPRFVPLAAREDPAAEELFYFRDDLDKTRGLHRLTLGPTDEEPVLSEDLVLRTAGDSVAAFTPEGAVVFSDSAWWRNLYARRDLFTMPKGERATLGTELGRTRLTEGLRANYVDVSPDGSKAVFVVNSEGTTTLTIAERTADGTLGPPRRLVVGKRWEQAYTPRFSPDGRFVAYSAWSEGGFRDLRLVEVATGAVVDLTRDRSLDLQPTWSADGKTIFFSSDRSGVFNVYALDVATRSTKMVTNVVGAALGPAVSADGKTLVYVGYTHDGYDLYRMALDPSQYLEAPPGEIERPTPYPEPPAIKYTKERYNPLATLRPRSYFLDVGPGNYGGTGVTLSASGGDILGHHSLSTSLRVEPEAPEPRFSLAYTYGRLPVNLGFRFTRATVPRVAGFSLGAGDIPFDESSTNFSSSVTIPIRHPFVSQSVTVGYTASIFDPRLDVPASVDPFGPLPQRPQSGMLSQLGLTYGLSTSQSSAYTAGSGRKGFDLGVSFSLADPAIGGTDSLYSIEVDAAAYAPMPWPGQHTLAMRASTGVASGTYARSGRYFVGGYDLQNTSPLDTILSGIYDGAFLLRGYTPGAAAGSEYFLSTIEYRAPIYWPNWGPGALPLFLRRIEAAAFADWGGAFDDFDFEAVRLFSNDRLIFARELKTSVGLELWLELTVAYRLPMNLRLGYAYGFDAGAYDGGQVYFISSNAF